MNPARPDELIDMISDLQEAISSNNFGGLTDGMGMMLCDCLQAYAERLTNMFLVDEETS